MKIDLEDIEKASSEMNLYYAGQHFGRPPTPIEAVRYYLEHTPRVRTFQVGLFPSEQLEEVKGEDLFPNEQFRKYNPI